MKLRAWDEALSWQESVQSYADEHSSSPLQKGFDTGYDTHYLRLSLNYPCSVYFYDIKVFHVVSI